MTIHDLLLQKKNDMMKVSLKKKKKKKKKGNSSKRNNSYNLLKRLISFKNKKTLSIGTSLNNCLIVST